MTDPVSPVRRLAALACLALGFAVAPLRAETLVAAPPPALEATTSLLSVSVLTRGSQSFSFELRVPAAGTFQVRLSDLAWPDRLAGLSFSLANSSGSLRTLQGAGTLSIDVGTAGSYFANVATRTQGTLGAGLFALDVNFVDATLPVPLPASGWLLVAAAATFAGLLHKGSRDAGAAAGAAAGAGQAAGRDRGDGSPVSGRDRERGHDHREVFAAGRAFATASA